MKEIQETASLAKTRNPGWRTLLIVLAPVLLIFGPACQIKRTVKVEVPSKILLAKSATLEQLVARLDEYGRQITSLTASSMKVTFTTGKRDSGIIQEYRSAPGYILLARPDMIRMVVQNPLTKTAILDLASKGDDFWVWIPRDNKLYLGHNSAKELSVKGESQSVAFTARPAHIFEAIFPFPVELNASDIYVALEEDQDSTTRYYVLSLYRIKADRILTPLRKLWIDRAEMAVARQLVYNQEGSVVSNIFYSTFQAVQNYYLPLRIRIERPLDGYSLDLEFREWQINSQLPDSAFMLAAPAGAQQIQLSETARSQNP
jgi:outer membrane lipoprotein-sorting protein